MKRLFVLLVAMLMLTGCNVVDNGGKTIAEITLQDGSVASGYVEKWDTYGVTNVMMVKINGVWYYTGAENVTLMRGDVYIETD